MKWIAVFLSAVFLSACSGFLKPDYRIGVALIGQQRAVNEINVVIKHTDKDKIYDHCIWLNGACYGESYEEMKRELKTALSYALAGAKGSDKRVDVTVEVLQLRIEAGLRSKATAKMIYRVHDAQSGRERFKREIDSEGHAFQVGLSKREGFEQNEALNRAVQKNLETFIHQLQQARILSF